MSNGSVDFQKSKAMPPRIEKDLVIAVVLALLPVILVAVLIVTGNGRGQEAEAVAPDGSSALSEGPSLAREPASLIEAPARDFDYAEMAEFYEANGLLGREGFDAEEAAELSALRWREMARFYEKNGLLTRGAPQSNVDLDQFTVAPNAEQARVYESVVAGVGVEVQSNRYLTEPGWLQARAYESGAARAAAVDQAYRHLIESGKLQARAYESDAARAAAADQTDQFLTEPGWLQARDYEALQSKHGAALSEEEYAFYTERYWNAAAGSQSARPVEEPAYTPSYLERGR